MRTGQVLLLAVCSRLQTAGRASPEEPALVTSNGSTTIHALHMRDGHQQETNTLLALKKGPHPPPLGSGRLGMP
ncbi:Efflux transporter, RND family, MFP subunit [Anopheles sinensis]|uniref:Efflux transporter, RND family, MFP subunit n=1 Tax=Anopheles sinensis TaxID=74873 RepID=A0A084W5S0_ANOSI|nr:Efflux transporter, RND family, MFP subunit [Anopheles sinensis]